MASLNITLPCTGPVLDLTCILQAYVHLAIVATIECDDMTQLVKHPLTRVVLIQDLYQC